MFRTYRTFANGWASNSKYVIRFRSVLNKGLGNGGGGGGGDSFFLSCEDFGGRFDESRPISVFLFFFFKVEIGSCAPIPFFTPGSVHKGSAS